MEYVSQAYFRAIQKGMVEAGFALISSVAISSDEIPYHVGGKARSTTLFFHLVSKGVIVQLEYAECIESEYPILGGRWNIRFYLQFRSPGELVRMNHEPRRQRLGDEFWDSDPYDGIPVLHDAVTLPGFRGNGIDASDGEGSVTLSFHQPDPSPDAMPVEQLLRSVRLVTDAVRPYLASGRMEELQVTCFPPYYTFKGCDRLFWQKFDLAYLKQVVVRRPWGSDMR